MLVLSRLDAALTSDEIYLRGLLDAKRRSERGTTMQLKQFYQGGCLLQLFTTDMALLALVLRHATSNNTEALLDLTPMMTTTLESLAATFELGTVVGLQQEGLYDKSARCGRLKLSSTSPGPSRLHTWQHERVR